MGEECEEEFPLLHECIMVMIPMLLGDDPNATCKLNSTSQTEV
jgi:hypothetical protein